MPMLLHYVHFRIHPLNSPSAIGTVLQRQDQGWRPLSFFSGRLTPAQCNYSAYDRELLAIYAAVKYFRFMLAGRRFFVIIDHKLFTFSFAQKLDHTSPRQYHLLTFISEFTTDIRHVPGKDNPVADALSRVDSIMAIIVDMKELAQQQATDKELL